MFLNYSTGFPSKNVHKYKDVFYRLLSWFFSRGYSGIICQECSWISTANKTKQRLHTPTTRRRHPGHSIDHNSLISASLSKASLNSNAWTPELQIHTLFSLVSHLHLSSKVFVALEFRHSNLEMLLRVMQKLVSYGQLSGLVFFVLWSDCATFPSHYTNSGVLLSNNYYSTSGIARNTHQKHVPECPLGVQTKNKTSDGRKHLCYSLYFCSF